MPRLLLLAPLLGLLVACGGAPSQRRTTPSSTSTTAPRVLGAPFSSPLRTGDPQVGRVFLGDRVIADENELIDQAMAADIVYLGEKHDNADHHRLQAAIIDALVRRGARPSIVLEMVDDDAQAKLDAAGSSTSMEQMAERLEWSRSGWPDFALYAPIFRRAIDHHLPLIAGNAPKAIVKQLAMAGHDPTAPAPPISLLNAFGLDVALEEPAQRSLLEELAESHCGMLPERALAPMAMAQRARDFTLARHAREAKGNGKGPRSIVIAGAGHARTDRGAPLYVRRVNPTLKQFSLAFTEVGSAPRAPFDARWYTPVANDEDHCKDFGKKP